jgi:type IV pilus assembly protein PilZ
VVEQRRFTRTPLDVEAIYTLKGGREAVKGVAKDISVGGMFIETPSPPAFGVEVVVRVRLPKVKDEMVLPGVVRWTSPRGMGVQFGLLGARETHTITEIVGKG